MQKRYLFCGLVRAWSVWAGTGQVAQALLTQMQSTLTNCIHHAQHGNSVSVNSAQLQHVVSSDKSHILITQSVSFIP